MNVRACLWMTIACFAALLASVVPIASVARAQTAPPSSASASSGAPVTIPMAREWALDAPPTWVRPTLPPGIDPFVARGDGMIIGLLQHVGNRPTELPYAVVEQLYPDAGMDSVAGRHEIVERIADYYRTALNPPSKADRSPSWRKSKVSPIRYDATSGQFRFEATITYDTVGDLHVVVSGLFNREQVLVFSGWSDPAFDEAHPGELSAIRDSLHLVGAAGAPLVSPAAYLRTVAQIVVGLIVVAVIVLQLVVWQRDRRARAGEAVELI